MTYKTALITLFHLIPLENFYIDFINFIWQVKKKKEVKIKWHVQGLWRVNSKARARM